MTIRSITVLVAMTGALSFAARAGEDMSDPVRPGDSAKGVPFWNDYATIFHYAPAFSFARVGGAVRYRFTVTNAMTKISFEAATPEAPLSPIWRDLPNGTGYGVICEGLGADGVACGLSGSRGFVKAAAFEDVKLPPAARPYRDAALRAFDYMTALPAMRTLVETGRPEQSYQHNAYVSKTHAAHILAMIACAKAFPDRRERAMRFARASAEFLLSELEPVDATLAYWPPTYGRKPLEVSAADGAADRQAMVGNEPQAAVKYRKEVMLVYPSDVGAAFLAYWKVSGDGRFLSAAKGIAETYLKTRRVDGTWPLKMILATGESVGRNTLVPVRLAAFFGELAASTGESRWGDAASDCFAALMNGPVKTMNWDGQFEDIEPKAPYQGLTKHNAIETSIELLKCRLTLERLACARELLRFGEDQFVFWEVPCDPDAAVTKPGGAHDVFNPGRYDYPSVFEQYSCFCAIDASAAKLIHGYLAMWRAERKALDLAKARALGDAITRTQLDSGRIPTFWTHDWLGAETYDWLNCMEASVMALLELAGVEE